MFWQMQMQKIQEVVIENLLNDLPAQLSLGLSWTDSLMLFFLLFFIGLTGIIFNYRNYLVTMLCIEIMYLGITVCFLIVGVSTADPKGQIYALILLIIAAAESAVGLGLLVVLYRFGRSIDFQDYQELKG
jgi:NADH:ubiquinone oxidoreductase subunit K